MNISGSAACGVRIATSGVAIEIIVAPEQVFRVLREHRKFYVARECR